MNSNFKPIQVYPRFNEKVGEARHLAYKSRILGSLGALMTKRPQNALI